MGESDDSKEKNKSVFVQLQEAEQFYKYVYMYLVQQLIAGKDNLLKWSPNIFQWYTAANTTSLCMD